MDRYRMLTTGMKILISILVCTFAFILGWKSAVAGETLEIGASLTKSSPKETKCPGKRRALILGGGGIRGAYQVGALWYLVNVLGCDFDHIFATSTGAIVGAVLAQAASHEELTEAVDMLVEHYKSLRDEGQIVEGHVLGEIRVLLPRWLGGVDGVYTLRPLEESLLKRVDTTRIKPGKFTVAVVSLQAGSVRDYRPDSMSDYVLGSASIPLAIEPRLARLWGRAWVTGIDGNSLIVESGPPGLADPECRIRLQESWIARCRNLGSERITLKAFGPEGEEPERLEPERLGPEYFRWRTRLELSDLSESDKRQLVELWEQTQGKGVGGIAVEFTAVHQLIDGGVTDNVPLRQALDVLSMGKEFDFLFVLTTAGWHADPVGNERVRGGLNIALKAFEVLWDSYQDLSLGTLDETFSEDIVVEYTADALAWIDSVMLWRQEFLEAIKKRMFGDPESAMVSRFPSWQPRIYREKNIRESLKGSTLRFPRVLVIQPLERFFKGTLDVNRDGIRMALRHGCVAAANGYVNVTRSEGSREPIFTVPVLAPEPLCDRMSEK